jgi:two-component system response regulator AtoC
MATNLIGISSNIQKVREQIQRVADTELNAVICGETGVGKELVVKMLFEKSARVGKPFVKVNCAALPDTLLESEMFGYAQGAFTGAVRKMRGKFEQAHKGLLFLDEIGDMSFPLQAKLLHALQDGEFTPLGSEKSFQSNTWVISATNHDLMQDLKEHKFRSDLYYRISESTIHIEPLRERPEDIPQLIDFYGEQYAVGFKKKWPGVISDDTIQQLCAYSWPGNVRELQNVLRRLIIIDDQIETIESMINNSHSANLTKASRSVCHSAHMLKQFGFNGEEPDLKSLSLKKIRKKASDAIEKQAICYVLDKTGWNRSRANKILGISYKTLLSKIQEFDLTPPYN